MLISYIIYPLIGLVMIGLGVLIAKKNNLVSNKKLILYLIISITLLSLPSLVGLTDYDFMPYGYLALVVIYLTMGYYNSKIIKWLFQQKATFLFELSLFTFIAVISMVLFSFLFNFCNELNYGIWASTSITLFLFPLLYLKTNQLFIDIPIEIYKVWFFDKSYDTEQSNTIDYSRLKLVKLELFKSEGDREPVTINAKAPGDMTYGAWFKRLLTDYNIKSPSSPIKPYINEGRSGWVFYYKPSFFLPRNYIDYDKTFKENKIKERNTIIAKRVNESIEQA